MNINAPSEVSPGRIYLSAISLICFLISCLNCFSAPRRSDFATSGFIMVLYESSGNLASMARLPVGSGRNSMQSTRVPFDSRYCSSKAFSGRALRTCSIICASPNAPRERLSFSTSCKLTTLDDSSVIFFCASSIKARRFTTSVKVSLVFSKPLFKRVATWPLISVRRLCRVSWI